MNTIKSLLFLLGLLMINTGCVTEPNGTMLVFGDQTVSPKGMSFDQTFSGVLQNRHPQMNVVVDSSLGRKFDSLSDFKKMCERTPEADVVLIVLGHNNAVGAGLKSDAAKQAELGTAALLEEAKKCYPDAKLVVCSPSMINLDRLGKEGRTAFGPHTPRLLLRVGEQTGRQAFKKEGVGWVDLYSVVSPENMPDGINPNAAGHRQIADVLWDAISERGKNYTGPDSGGVFAKVPPSANKGRRGSYKVHIPKYAEKKYYYHVYVPSTYSPDNPAGLLLFNHGNGGAFRQRERKWWKDVLFLMERHNLIGVCPQFHRGNNQADTDNKAEVARIAVSQALADYKIIPGRGINTCASAGGYIQGKLLSTIGQRDADLKGGHRWPFVHIGQYSAFMPNDVGNPMPMSWSFHVGQREWNMVFNKLNLNERHRRHTRNLFSDGAVDVYFKVDEGKGHAINDSDYEVTSEMFARSELALAPFIYQPDYSEKELAPLVEPLDKLKLGEAYKNLPAVLSATKNNPQLQAKARDLEAKLDKRIKAIQAMMVKLTQEDPVLATRYGKLWISQLEGHPAQKTINQLYAKAAADKSAHEAFAKWVKKYDSLLVGKKPGAFLPEDKVEQVKKIQAMTPKKSLVGRMTAEYLKLRDSKK